MTGKLRSGDDTQEVFVAMPRENVPLSDKTSYRIGGPARYYAEPADEGEIVELYRYAFMHDMPAFVLGKGSNVLIGDKGIDGLVINLSAKFTSIKLNGTMIAAQGGASLDELIRVSVNNGLTGMEELSGIPGTVGGAVAMNAGAFDTDISKTLRGARVLRTSSSLTIENVDAKDLYLGYRSSAIKGSGDVVLSAAFEFGKEDISGQASSIRDKILNRRREKQPLDKPSCGSVFKRPPGNYAGTLIESCGLKGFRIGAAMVSDRHANFIINTGGATADDVRGVMRHIQEAVYEKSGILLEPEVIFIGE